MRIVRGIVTGHSTLFFEIINLKTCDMFTDSLTPRSKFLFASFLRMPL